MQPNNSLIDKKVTKVAIHKSVLIQAGDFWMGAESDGWGESEYPAHKVFVSDFLLDIHHVTNTQFRAFVDTTGYQTTAELKGGAHGYQSGEIHFLVGLHWRSYATDDRDQHPVVLVSWLDANAYCQWAGKRLPTEAEWEYAARGGLTRKLYPWGDEQPSVRTCNMAQQTIDTPPTTPIMTYPPNAFGVYDMAGNVWDICSDNYDPTYYVSSSEVDPQGPSIGDLICRRGASFNIIQAFRCRNANRGAFPKDGYAINVGFRCAETV